MSNVRRRQRSTRIVVAGSLLVAASLVVTTAVVMSSINILIAAAVSALLAGIAAARIISNELAQTRREWAHDRAEQARNYQSIMEERTRENAAFAATMTDRVRSRDRRIVELDGTLRLVEARATQAEHKVTELQGTVESLRAEQDESVPAAMALWDGADVPTIVDLLNWEAGVESTRESETETETERKQA